MKEDTYSVSPKSNVLPISLRTLFLQTHKVSNEKGLYYSYEEAKNEYLKIEQHSPYTNLVVIRVFEQINLFQLSIIQSIHYDRKRSVHHIHQLIHIRLIKSNTRKIVVQNSIEVLWKDENNVFPEVE